MKTLEEFFDDVSEFKEYVEGRRGKTIHTNHYENWTKEIYAEWHQAKISLKPFVNEDVINELDEKFSQLLSESRASRSSVSQSSSYLQSIEDIYIERIFPQISGRSIESGFVNSIVTELDSLNDEKYHEYMEEAVKCVQAEAFRGAVVLGWQAGMYALYQALKDHNEPIHVLYQKEFKTLPDFQINDFWDFQKINDRNILILAKSAGIFDKSLKDMLDRERDVRNKAAHPGIYDVGPNGTKAFLEIILQLLQELER